MRKYLIILIALLFFVSPAYAAFSGYLKADTSVTILVGPFVDDSDGNTEETGLTISQADVRLSKNAGNMAQKNESTSCTHDELGYYGCPLDTTDTNTEGILQIVIHESGALLVEQTYMVLNANVFDSLFAAATTDYLQIDILQVAGDAIQDNNDGRLEVNVEEISDVAVSTSAAQLGVNVVEIEAADATDQVGDAVWDEVIVGAHDTANTSGALLDSPGDWLTATGFSTHSAADVWAVGTRALTDKTGFSLAADQSAVTIGTVNNASVSGIQIAALADFFDTNSGTTYGASVAGSVVKEIADNAGGSTLTEAGIADAVWDEVIVGAHDTANTSGALLDSPGDWLTATGFSTHSAADVWAVGTRALTDKTGFSLAADQSAVTIGTVSTLTGHTPQTGDSFARIGVAGAGLTALPWNSLWDSEVQSEVADALTAYDPPTQTEMAAAFTEIKGSTWSDSTDTLEHIRDKQTDIETDTQDIQSRLPAALISGKMSSDMVALSGNTDSADMLELSSGVIVEGTAVAGTLSTTQMSTDLTESTDDHYNGRIIIWTSGVLQNQATDITDYQGSSKTFTFTAVTEAPSEGDTFVIL